MNLDIYFDNVSVTTPVIKKIEYGSKFKVLNYNCFPDLVLVEVLHSNDIKYNLGTIIEIGDYIKVIGKYKGTVTLVIEFEN